MGKILIIEDNRKNAEIFKDFISAWGYKTLEAYQGREGLEMAIKEKPDVILLDVMLPGISGYEICHELKNSPETKEIAIVMVSALSAPEDQINGFKNGADSFLIKPVNYKLLKSVLDKVMHDKKQHDSLELQSMILEKMYFVVKSFLCSVNFDYDEQKRKFYSNVLRRLELDEASKEHILWVACFIPLYKEVIKQCESLEKFNELMEGFKFSKWFIPLLEYCTCDDSKKKFIRKILQERNLDLCGDYCLTISRLDDILQKNTNDLQMIKNAFMQEQMSLGYTDVLIQAFQREFEAYEIRKRLELE